MPEGDFPRFMLIMLAVLLTFALLYKIVDIWADSVKERRRLNSIIERTDQINDDTQNDPQSR